MLIFDTTDNIDKFKITEKLKELAELSELALYRKRPEEDIKEFLQSSCKDYVKNMIMKTIEKDMLYTPVLEPEGYFRNIHQLYELDDLAKSSGEILGRYISVPFADGNAVYQIVAEKELEVRIRICIGLGDDWQLPSWGKETWIARNYAEALINKRDELNNLCEME